MIMPNANERKLHQSDETEILHCALKGNLQAINKTLDCLSSPYFCRTMQEAIHEMGDSRIWNHLLHLLGLGCWDGHELRALENNDLKAYKRIDQSIVEVFIEDKNAWEKQVKEELLRNTLNMNNPEPLIRQAAAYLLGLRGEQQVIPVLEEIIETGSTEWRLRAVRALVVLNDKRCGPPLLKALIMDRGKLHREARRALQSLGTLAEPVWLAALNHPDTHIRWEAARGLGEIGDPRAALILAEGLLDESYAVRWASGDVLAQLGECAVPAILVVLRHQALSETSRQAASHTLHGITSPRVQKRIRPLLEVLNSGGDSDKVPAVARRLLMEWEKTPYEI